MNSHEKQENLLNEAYNYLSYLESQEEGNVFRKASEKSLKKVWDNKEDDIYNTFAANASNNFTLKSYLKQ
ncbi:hypothetical protein ABWH96_00590 [Marivirga tractuosa]|uniref:hypothetical protein n=1 Tax=Marivirga tractuosa TaxID=1006 RepID=UPI0035CFDEC6